VARRKVDPGFERLYEAEFSAVFRAVYLLCGDRIVAEDATQEAFARALARWRRLRNRPWAGGWVTTTALNVARRSLRRPRGAEMREAGDPDVDAILDLRKALAMLPPRQQEALILHHLEDRPVADVAAAMGVAEGTVKSHLHRARQALAEKLGGRV
jgi:RNA polymerase sigma-70 factor (ECF subfamily)